MDFYDSATEDNTAACRRAWHAAVQFLAEDPRRWQRALETHLKGSHGLCTQHSEQWPCLLYRMAEEARDLCEQFPISA